jgi:hypothetical protein
LFGEAQGAWIAQHRPLAATQRQVENRALPRHQHRERADFLGGRARMKAHATFEGPACVVVLHSDRAKHPRAAIVHPDRYGHMVLMQRRAEERTAPVVEAKAIRDGVELCERFTECA